MKEIAPRVSVIIATYNRRRVLRYAIQSVLWQSMRDFELLVIGDGCTDDSGDVVASFGDSRIHWQNLSQNSGHQSTPNNLGLKIARGKYIAYLGHDDLWHPKHLTKLTDALEFGGADIAFSVCENIGPPDRGQRVLTGISPSGAYERGLIVPPSSLMHRRTLTQELGGWKDYRKLSIQPDTELSMRAFDKGKKFAAVNELTVFKFPASWRKDSYRIEDASQQADYVRRIVEEPDFLERELLAVARYYAISNPEWVLRTVKFPGAAPPGARVEEARRFRGLEPREQEQNKLRSKMWKAGRSVGNALRQITRLTRSS